MHTWANFVIEPGRPHWGFSSANGVLGGFDSAELVRLGNGRYAAGSFGTLGNDLPYSPIELYLAGLIAPEEVPDLWVANDGRLVGRPRRLRQRRFHGVGCRNRGRSSE